MVMTTPEMQTGQGLVRYLKCSPKVIHNAPVKLLRPKRLKAINQNRPVSGCTCVLEAIVVSQPHCLK